MLRLVQLLAVTFVVLCAAFVAVSPRSTPLAGPPHAAGPAQAPVASGSWFDRMRPYCNAVEVETRMRYDPPPPGVQGSGFAAACLALAGRVDSARARIDALPADERATAAGIVFEIGHPVADMGDDRSAGPIMELVVDYQPDNYMALYHAGASEYQLRQFDLARTHLGRFLQVYRSEDGWTGNARALLRRLDGAAPQVEKGPADGER
jgi:hypothetical protein